MPDGQLAAGSPDLSAMIPATRFFTISSKRVGATFGIWVTVPPQYYLRDVEFPILYVTDANMQVALTAPLGLAMSVDPVRPVRPFIQVAIGYIGEDVANFIRVRNRDLVPPREPYPTQMANHLKPRVDRGLISEAELSVLLEDLKHTAGDRFLAFITEELHPEIARQWRVHNDDVGLFGYSYGGLFSLFAFGAAGTFFRTVGASSPGILSADSDIFSSYRRLVDSPSATYPERLHLTINASECFGPEELYRDLARQYLALVDTMRRTPLPRLRATAETILGEVHGTGIADAFRSFVRSCYGIAGPARDSFIVGAGLS